MEVETISTESVKPCFPTPPHLRNYRLCLLDQFVPPFYTPMMLFYSAAQVLSLTASGGTASTSTSTSTSSVAEKLKMSLSKTLSVFYPLAGRLRGNSSIECNDEGALFVEARAHGRVLSEILEDPDDILHVQRHYLPFPPYEMMSSEGDQALLGVKLNTFDCGGIGIGVCFSHKTFDGSTAATFLKSWSSETTALIRPDGCDQSRSSTTRPPPPCLDASTIFQPNELFNFSVPSGVMSNEKLTTKRFHFGAKQVSKLMAGEFHSIITNPTRVEAITALIWKAALQAAKESSEEHRFPPSAATHVVDIRSRAVPPLTYHTLGNLWQFSVAPLLEIPKDGLELHHLAALIRKSTQSIDSNHVNNLKGEDGFKNACKSIMEIRQVANSKGGSGGVELYRFSSVVRFPFYEVDFGWGSPIWVCLVSAPVKNTVVLMGTRSGDGIEALITLTEGVMAQFEANPMLLQFVSASTTPERMDLQYHQTSVRSRI